MSPLTREDFDQCFADEPVPADPELVVVEVRRSVRRWNRRLACAIAVTIVVLACSLVAALVGLGVLPLQRAITVPSPVSHGRDNAPYLAWSETDGYRDRLGKRTFDGNPVSLPFQASRDEVDTVTRHELDPRHQHLTAAGSAVDELPADDLSSAAVRVEAFYYWSNPDEQGQGFLSIAVGRMPPDTGPALSSSPTQDFCSRQSMLPASLRGSVSDCTKQVVDGTTVWMRTVTSGGFMLAVWQADGEFANIEVEPVSTYSTRSLLDPPLTPEAAVRLLLNPNLDVIG